jgi:hypothetical protein
MAFAVPKFIKVIVTQLIFVRLFSIEFYSNLTKDVEDTEFP